MLDQIIQTGYQSIFGPELPISSWLLKLCHGSYRKTWRIERYLDVGMSNCPLSPLECWGLRPCSRVRLCSGPVTD